MKNKKVPEAVEFNVLRNRKGETQSATRGRWQRKVEKRCGEKQSSDKRREKAEDCGRPLVQRRDSCQRGGETLRLYRLFVAETE